MITCKFSWWICYILSQVVKKSNSGKTFLWLLINLILIDRQYRLSNSKLLDNEQCSLNILAYIKYGKASNDDDIGDDDGGKGDDNDDDDDIWQRWLTSEQCPQQSLEPPSSCLSLVTPSGCNTTPHQSTLHWVLQALSLQVDAMPHCLYVHHTPCNTTHCIAFFKSGQNIQLHATHTV